MRETCLFCVSKHISQAIVLVSEAAKGYPYHIWIAIGHLAEAEDECMNDFHNVSQDIRKVRLALMGQDGEFKCNDLMDLLIEVRKVAEFINEVPEEKRIEKILNCKN